MAHSRPVSMPATLPALHKQGRPFVLLFAAASIGLGLWVEGLFWIGLILTLWCAAFFRDPERVTPPGPGLFISPADGVILPPVTSVPPIRGADKKQRMRRVSIFMNVFDVHVNRLPCSGKILSCTYRPGAFFNASLDKASTKNERMAVHMRSSQGHDIFVVQIAGLIARRIVCDVKPGQRVKAGHRFGMIRFGSRVDVYLPLAATVHVHPGQRGVAGETVLATMKPGTARRKGASPDQKTRSVKTQAVKTRSVKAQGTTKNRRR